MSGSVNKVILIGGISVATPKCGAPTMATPVVSFSLATTESWRDKATGERLATAPNGTMS